MGWFYGMPLLSARSSRPLGTPYELRFGPLFKGPEIPFGAMVEYFPISAQDQSRLHQFGEKVLPGIFFGYALVAGGIWIADILVADIEELRRLDAGEIHARCKGVNQRLEN